MQRALDFDKTPALGVPLPFLLNVPLFALMAGLLATWYGPQLFESRWSPAALAMTHLWTLGILGSAMLGALVQIMAVACNVPVHRARLVTGCTHALFSAGTLLLVAGFVGWSPFAWLLAAVLLAMAFGLYLVSLALALWHERKQVYKGAREILVPVRGALVALAITVLIGLHQISAFALGRPLPDLVGTHVLWGLLGWGGLLLMGMSFQLLPIFQLTELYPGLLTRWLPLLIPGLLLAWTALDATSGLPHLMRETAELLLCAAYMLWVLTTLHRLWTRKRPQPEPTSLFWFASMISLLACAPAWIWLNHSRSPEAAMILGTLIIVGGLGSAVNGMLYKIFPFLLWKHAQDAIVIPDHDPTLVRVYRKVLPKMAEYIPERRGQWQWCMHVLTVLSWTLSAGGWQFAGHVAGPLLLASAGMLAWNMARALLLYRSTLRAMAGISRQLQTAA